MSQHTPVVVIVGGGFGGLAAARALKQAPVKVVLIDRANHHLFQPLLYQVATSVLAPGQIGSPIRGILRNSDNTTVILGNVTGIDAVSHCVVAVRNKILQAFEIAEAEEDSSRHKDPLTFVLVGTERILAGHQRNLLPERLGQPSASVRERDNEPAKELD